MPLVSKKRDNEMVRRLNQAPSEIIQPTTRRTIASNGIDLGDVWRHYCTVKEEGEVVDRGP
jgi:hypothetical protein